ncbi:Ubiquitin carboxyl-terminal hydrolase 34-like protein [Cladobotryum mycophilum]|uniref:Ubiquitin carboxyl-terminal hydrolase 34-like protein n=1 Tax=Cladobotryum mycophilum TaxID=491253 RepID=A0ABR0SBL2_9HYPO
MDPSLISTHCPSPTVSPEPSSTRPNPFDDGDVSSRKRRRTSPSGSPSAPAEMVQPIHPVAQSDAVNGLDSTSDSQMKLQEDSDSPRTPEQPHASRMSPEEPPQARESIPDEGQIKKSVEEPELDLAQDFSINTGISQPSSSGSATPPIEVITIQETDGAADGYDDISFDPSNVEVSIIDQDVVFTDPTTQFPYRDPEETLPETVQRLIQFIAMREYSTTHTVPLVLDAERCPVLESSLDGGVLDQIQGWLELYLRFAKHVGPQAVLDSCRRFRNFWLALPEVFLAISNRKSSFSKSASLQTTIVQLYSKLAELTALFVGIDRYTIREWHTSTNRSDTYSPLLFSIGYLQQFHNLMRRPEPPVDIDIASDSPKSRGSIESLGNLASELIEVIQTFPRMADSLAPVVQVLSHCLRVSYQTLRKGQQDVSRVKQQLKFGHGLWHTISSFLNTTIEKHITYFSSDSASSEIGALAEILRWCLESDHEDATAVLKDHQQTYPGIPPKLTTEAVSLEWKLSMLGKLIRCSQMQLRVMAVTNLCADLVAIWKRLCDASEEHNIVLLNHLGTHLLQIKLIDYIIGPNCHPEIIVESANIVGFLVVTKLYRAEHTDRLWQGITASQDPRVADAQTRMVTTIANLFDYLGLLGFCEKFQTLPIDGFNPALRILWDTVLREMVARCQIERTTLSFLPYKICLRLLRESSVCASGSQVANPEIQHAVMQKFKDLLTYGPDPQGRRELYLSCIEDVAAKSPTTLGSLWCLSMAIRPAIIGEMKVLTEQHDLVRLIVEELEHAIKAGQLAGVPAVLSGSTNQPRRDFITNIIQLEPDALLNDLGSRLWDILVGPRSPCSDDRKSGWDIIIDIVRRTTDGNPFIQMCVSQHLPRLPSRCFSEGMLEFVKEQVFRFVNENLDCALDDDALVAKTSIEDLWRIILTADDVAIVELAIQTMAIDVYLESNAIISYQANRARQVHLSLVARCLNQMKDAAGKLKAASDGTSSGDDESMVIVATDEEVLEQERVFTRTLQLLRFFVEAHHMKPHFSAPDLRLFISHEPSQVEGDLAQLKYQSFDGVQQTDVKPLHIGKLNTAASLLASLRKETGFDNYRVFYRGRPFLPTEDEICKSLKDLSVHEGLILVKREESCPPPLVRIKPGSSPLEIEILSHFDELWEYLSMDDQIAKEIYNFLVKLPADGQIMDLFENETTPYEDVFFSGQPFKSLYAIHTLVEYIEAARLAASNTGDGIRYRGFSHTSYEGALSKCLHLVVQAISDQHLIERANPELQIQLMSSLMHAFVRFLRDHRLPVNIFETNGAHIPSADRLVSIISHALTTTEESAVPLIASSLASVFRLGLLNAQFWVDVESNTSFSQLIGRLILTDHRKSLREICSGLVEETIETEIQTKSATMIGSAENGDLPSYTMTFYIWSSVSCLLEEAANLPYQCTEYFRLVELLLLRMSNVVPSEVDFHRIAARLSGLLLGHTSTEEIDQIEPLDSVARGLVSLLHLCMHVDETLHSSSVFQEDIPEILFWQYLFPQRRTRAGQPVPKVLLNSDTRAKLCEVIFRLVRNDQTKLGVVLESLKSLVPYYSQDEDDPYLYELPFQFVRSNAMRSPCGYVGLRNLSNTCYLNSLLTQLFMNTNFRQFIMQSSIRNSQDSQQLLFQTQKLFGFMQGSYRRFIDPGPVVGAIKTYEDTFIDIHNQMDVDEFYNLLFDRWEGQLSTANEKKTLRSFYGGQLVQQVKSKECDHISERLEPFSAIQCDIKGKNTLQESLQAYVDGEIMEGDNKYKCSTCDRHVDAVKRACLKDIPDHLIFHLKRFDFNLRTLQRSKINDYFSFPTTIDMRPYTIQHLSDPAAESDQDLFELVGILIHSGTAESGHYYSYTRERPTSPGRPSWVEFNDDHVAPWDPANMEASTFGGLDHRSAYETNGVIYDKSYSAYMLFYQRASSLEEEQKAMSSQELTAPLRVEIDPEMTDHLQNENTIILRRHCLFDPSHILFTQNCFAQATVLYEQAISVSGRYLNADVTERPGLHTQKSLAMEMGLSHLDQVVVRTKDTPDFGTFSMMIRASVQNCADCAFAYYDYFSLRPGSLRAMLQRSPDPVIRAFAGKTLIHALAKISAHMPEIYHFSRLVTSSSEIITDDDEHSMDGQRRSNSPQEHSVLEGTMFLFDYLWRYFPIHIRAWDEHFGTMLEFARLGDREVGHLLANDFLLKLLRIVAADPLLDLPASYSRMLNNILRRPSGRIPSYISILSLIHHLLQRLEPVLGPDCIVDSPMERLEHAAAPFPWTSDEVHLIHHHPERHLASFFVEKLLGLDQASITTFDILGRLVSTGDQLDVRVLNALRKNLQGDTTTQPMDPFLRAAGKYLESTHSLDQARVLIRHIAAQAKSLQHAEGAAFLDFFSIAFHLKRPELEMVRAIRDCSIQSIPSWAPYLLVYAISSIRYDTETVMDNEVFHFALQEPTENARDMTARKIYREVAQKLGMSCLTYLRDTHTRRRAQIGQEPASTIIRVIGKSSTVFTANAELSDMETHFRALHSEVVGPLRRLIVDDIDEEASEWEGSCASSEPTDGVQPVHDLDDTNLI